MTERGLIVQPPTPMGLFVTVALPVKGGRQKPLGRSLRRSSELMLYDNIAIVGLAHVDAQSS